MNIPSTADILPIVLSHGYLIMFLLMCIEGPLVAFAASFAAALGYFDVWIVGVLFVLGNQIPDVIIFEVGRYARKRKIHKLISFFRVDEKKIKWVEKNTKKHFVKTLLITKSIPSLPTPGILLFGYTGISLKRFFWADLIYNVFYSIFWVSFGFYSGMAANASLKYFRLGEYLPIIALVLLALVYLLIRWSYSIVLKMLKD